MEDREILTLKWRQLCHFGALNVQYPLVVNSAAYEAMTAQVKRALLALTEILVVKKLISQVDGHPGLEEGLSLLDQSSEQYLDYKLEGLMESFQ